MTDDVTVEGYGAVSGPTRESVERLRRQAEESGDAKDRAAYERARDALAAQEQEQ